MKRLLRLATTSLVLLALVIPIQGGNADANWIGDPGESWPIPNDADRGMHVQQFIDSFPGESSSFLIDNALRQDKMVDPTCKSVDDPRCTSSELQYSSL